ncbi:hypothetical protein FHX42_001304 [Saccharopolyspora lacisalsi]|uniref:Integrase n=1 Tax=Halosaccharopolyspora lacisalsi TaxID=1000566 RepID=A0A839DX88_9PSEU|nr:hypothetical protein [Halosaccharopolyspora lacisalsi]
MPANGAEGLESFGQTEKVATAVGHAHISTTLRYYRRRD